MVELNAEAASLERPTEADCAADGRRLRSERSRKAIVAALISLIRKGETMPSAERVADEANIGLRTVFRHFDDMDRLYQEVIEHIETEIAPLIEKPYEATDWHGRLSEMIDRRAQVFELVMPFKLQSNARLLQSEFLQEMHRCAVALDRERMIEIMPASIVEDETRFCALFASLSFDVWIHLRKDQGRSPAEAAEIMRCAAESILAGIDRKL